MSISGVTMSCAGLGRDAAGGRAASGVRGGGKAFSVREVASAPLGSLTLRKWQLDNGLQVITVPDGGARTINYVTIFRVGSRDEDAAAGQTGLAHLFEHLMFTGTSTGINAQADFDQQLEEVGGSSNAATYYDFTSYIDELPPEALDLVIRLEADRMVNLNLGDKQVANEREVVIQERLGTVDDSVDGTIDEMLWQQAFRAHPYRWPIIGRMADIKSVTKDKALAFYRKHYAPNRAVIVLAGRFEEAGALKAIAAAYGGLSAGPDDDASGKPVPERAPAAEIRTRIERPLPADRLVIGYPAPALGATDRAAFDLLDELLTGGPSSRLYRSLVVDRELASSVLSDPAPTRDPGLWCLWVQMTRGNEAGRAEELITRELTRLARQPAAAAELTAAKNRLETAFWEELASGAGRAEALGHFEVTTGDFRNLLERSRAYARVTAEEVQQVARAYLEPGARSVVIASPTPGASPASEGDP